MSTPGHLRHMHKIGDVHAVVLVGGLGTRLRRVVADRPKPLAEVAGRPFLAHVLDALAAVGVAHATLCTGYLGEMVRAALGRRHGPLRLSYSHEDKPLGTAGAVRAALPRITTQTLLVANGDSLCDMDVAAFHDFHVRRRAGVSLALAHVDDASRFGQVLLGEEGQVVRFCEKQAQAGPGWINAGMYLIQRDVLEGLGAAPVSFERDVFPSLIRGSRKDTRPTLFGWPHGGAFLDMGTPESLAQAEDFVSLHASIS